MKCLVCGSKDHNMTGHYACLPPKRPVTTPVTTPKKVPKSVTTRVTTRKSSDIERVRVWREKNREKYNASVRDRRRKLKYGSEEEGT